jgi:hypothetical protein
MNQTVVIGNTTRFIPLQGGQQQPNEENGTGLSPNEALVLKDFGAEATGGIVGAESATLTVMVENAATSVTCSLTGAVPSCGSGAQVTIPPRSRVSVRVANTAAGNPAIGFSWTFARP